MCYLYLLWCYVKVEIQGLTGKISFEQGRRMDFKLDILHLKSTGLIKVSKKQY